jgi:Arc/MetJ-type ribon-helix-helix transcriptional regulator
MRTIINISLPAELNQEVEKALKTGNFATKSEFFRHLLRLWKEEQALQGLRESQREIAKGEGKILKSLKDLR